VSDPSCPPAPQATPDKRVSRAARRRLWVAFAPVLFPLFFLVVIGIGVAAMYYRQMQFFKPAPLGAAPPASHSRSA